MINVLINNEAMKICTQIYKDYYSTIYPDATEEMIDFVTVIKLNETDFNWKRQIASKAIEKGVA